MIYRVYPLTKGYWGISGRKASRPPKIPVSFNQKAELLTPKFRDLGIWGFGDLWFRDLGIYGLGI